MMSKDIFHVHTYRCGHSTDEADHLYIEKAISLGADSIAFTDHAPFPGDPFEYRMRYEQLPEYIGTLQRLREAYKQHIQVRIGLEIEYLKSYENYYKQLRGSGNLDLLIIGQHFYEIEPGFYSFSETNEVLATTEAVGFAQAIADGVATGLFDAVAHPDRSFRRRKKWGENETALAMQIITAAKQYGVPLEQNESSKRHINLYRPEFWQLCDGVEIIHGLDAHGSSEIRLV